MSFRNCKRPEIIKNKFISTFIGSAGVAFGLAFAFPMSNISVYITSYIHEYQDFVTMHYGLFLNLIYTFAHTLGGWIGGILEHVIGFIFTTLSGFLLILIANIFMINIKNIWLCYVLFFIISTGLGISNSLIGKNLVLYKPDKKGILISALVAIIILFSALYTVSGEKVINTEAYTLGENEEFYPLRISERTYLYFLIGFFTAPIGVIIFLLFIYEKKAGNDKEDHETLPEEKTHAENKNDDNIEKTEEEINNNNNNSETDNKENNIEIEKEIKSMNINIKQNIKKALKSFRFWRLACSQLLVSFSTSFISGTGRTFGALIGIEGTALQLLMMFQLGSLILFGPIIGILVDKIGPLILLRIMSIFCLIPGVLLTFFTEITAVFIISFILAILGLVGNSTCLPPLIMEIYGIQESVILNSTISIFSKLSEIITTISGFVISLYYTKQELLFPYRIMYITGAICCALCFILLFFESKNKFIYDDEKEEEKEGLGGLIEDDRLTETNTQ